MILYDMTDLLHFMIHDPGTLDEISISSLLCATRSFVGWPVPAVGGPGRSCKTRALAARSLWGWAESSGATQCRCAFVDVPVCMSTSMYRFAFMWVIYACMYIRACIHINIYIYIHTTYLYIRIHTYIHTYAPSHICMYICMQVRLHAQAHVYTRFCISLFMAAFVSTICLLFLYVFCKYSLFTLINLETVRQKTSPDPSGRLAKRGSPQTAARPIAFLRQKRLPMPESSHASGWTSGMPFWAPTTGNG